MQRMTTLLCVRAKIDDFYYVIRRRAGLCSRVVTGRTNNLGIMQINEIDSVVVRTVLEGHCLIDVTRVQVIR